MLERLRGSVERKISPVNYTAKLAGISRGDRVLEIGCWYNRGPASELAGICGSVYPIDNIPKRVKEYKSIENTFLYLCSHPWEMPLYLNKRRKIQPMAANAYALPFAENSLDGILFYHAFSLIYIMFGGSEEKALESVHNSLKLGKYVIAIENSSNYLGEIEEMFKDIGFYVERDDKIVLGKKVLKDALGVYSGDEYLSVPKRIERRGRETIERIREAIERIERDGEKTRKAIEKIREETRKDGEKTREERRSL